MTTGHLPICSFCGKSHTEVRKLIAGPGVYVCDQCVDLCEKIIADELAKGTPAEDRPDKAESTALPQPPLWERIDSVDQALDLIPKVAAAGAQAEANLTSLVRRTRALGATWAKIGEALGMTRQSAWGRFSGEE
jgi:hypothetical protein